MKSKLLLWIAIILVLGTGILHLIAVPDEYSEAPYMGWLFIFNFIGSLIAAWGILRNKIIWGWGLGSVLVAGSIIGYLLSRTFCMPGMEVEEWANLQGILSLISGKGLDQSFKDVCSAIARESFGINSYGLIGLLAMTVETAFLGMLALAKPWADPVMNSDYLAFNHSVKQMRQSRFFLPAMMVSMVLISFFSYQVGIQNAKAHDSGHPLPETIISAQTLEEEYGVQMYLVAVTAAGGMVDVRYRIIEPDKAAKLVDPEDGGIMPMVYVQNGDIMLMPDMHMRTQQLIADRMYFTLIPNTQNAVHRGTIVTVSFGVVALEPMIAR